MALKARLTFSEEKKALPFYVCINSIKMLLRGNPTNSLFENCGPIFKAESMMSSSSSPLNFFRVSLDLLMAN